MNTASAIPLFREYLNFSSEITFIDELSALRTAERPDFFYDFLEPESETTELPKTTNEVTTTATTTTVMTSTVSDMDRLRQEDWNFQFYPRADDFLPQIRRLPDIQYIIQFFWPEFSDIGSYFTYGCNCYFLGDWFYGQLSDPGYGEPVDAHDTICYKMKKCYQKSLADFGDECRAEFVSTKKILSRDRRKGYQ